MYPCEKQHVEQIRDLAREAFRDHQITQNVDQGLYRHWTCARPGSGMYRFNVITEPWRLIVTGDLGVLILCREKDMLPWLRGAIDNPDYLSSKAQPPTHAWSGEVALAWVEFRIEELKTEIREEAEDCPDSNWGKKLTALLGKYELLREEVEGGEHAFTQALHDSGVIDDCDFPRLETFTSQFLWCREALRCFLANVTDVTA